MRPILRFRKKRIFKNIRKKWAPRMYARKKILRNRRKTKKFASFCRRVMPMLYCNFYVDFPFEVNFMYGAGSHDESSKSIEIDTKGFLSNLLLEYALKYRNVMLMKYKWSFHNLNVLVQEGIKVSGKTSVISKDTAVTRANFVAAGYDVKKQGLFERCLAAFYASHDDFSLIVNETPRIKWKHMRRNMHINYHTYLRPTHSIEIDKDVMGIDLSGMEEKCGCRVKYFKEGQKPKVGVGLSGFEPSKGEVNRVVIKTVTGHVRLKVYVAFSKRLDQIVIGNVETIKKLL